MITLLILCWKKSLTTQKTTTLTVHFTDTHPKAANFWHVWLYWADFFHASGHKAASTSEQGKHYNSLQCLPLQLLPSSGLHSLMTQYLAACCKSMKKKSCPWRESIASCKQYYSGLEGLLATPLGWASPAELLCDSAHSLLTSAPLCCTSIGDGE